MDEPIATLTPPTGLGWDAARDREFVAHAAAGRIPARVVAAFADQWTVATATGDATAFLAGRFRYDVAGPGDLPAVGDWLAVDPPDGRGGPAVIHGLLERRSAFRRYAGERGRGGPARLIDEQVLAANVDVALIVAGLDGDFDLRRIERYLAVVFSGGATPVLVLNKADVDPDVALHRLAASSVAPGVAVHVISARDGSGVDALAATTLPPGTTAVVIGSSGVGKSTLANALLGTERQRTRDVREDDSRGRHTTTSRELLRLPTGAVLIDTPGIRALEVTGAADGLDDAFAEIAAVAVECRFRDCRHEGEPGCAVEAAIATGVLDAARLNAYRKLEREAAHATRTVDPLARAEDRRRWKAIHKSVSVHMRTKYGSDR
jgi:ribosome biogenesis GTPase / thiamine phosphate phosphatase